jgi:hybrid cluster-associated redox disulfide protein
MVAPDRSLNDVLQVPVAEALRRWPAAAGAFIALRMACVGCAFMEFDTVEEALEAHHIRPGRMLAAFMPFLIPMSHQPGSPVELEE